MSLVDELRERRDSLEAGEELVFATQDVPVELLRLCYPLGIFPWPYDESELIPWVCPSQRAILHLDQFSLGRSSRRGVKRGDFRITFNEAFNQVIQHCAEVPGRDTWIFPVMQHAYKEAHNQGFAESVEVWQEDRLVGGLYGIWRKGCFSGESMFHTVSHAGKAAVAGLMEELRARGSKWLDIQQLTPHMEAMGAEEVDRNAFLTLLRQQQDSAVMPQETPAHRL